MIMVRAPGAAGTNPDGTDTIGVGAKAGSNAWRIRGVAGDRSVTVVAI